MNSLIMLSGNKQNALVRIWQEDILPGETVDTGRFARCIKSKAIGGSIVISGRSFKPTVPTVFLSEKIWETEWLRIYLQPFGFPK